MSNDLCNKYKAPFSALSKKIRSLIANQVFVMDCVTMTKYRRLKNKIVKL